MQKSLFLLCLLTASTAFARQMYEWRDPATGRLKLGDKPPAGVQYWEEGTRVKSETESAPQKPIIKMPTAEQRALQEQKEREASARYWADRDRKRKESNEAAELLGRPIAPSAPAADRADVAIFDIEAKCKGVSQAVGGSYQIEQTCRDQERKAKENISTMGAAAEIIAHCERVGRAVGGSYQIMETCIEQETKAKANLR
ncbi:MAG: DUF4124 domain-containing protein [Candidatus Competibacter sp.]